MEEARQGSTSIAGKFLTRPKQVVKEAFHAAAFPKKKWVWKGQPDYKTERLNEYADMLRKRGIKDEEVIRLMLAQLTQENGALAEDVIGDHGCSVGIPQYNACAHGYSSAKALIKAEPQWADYDFQLNWMADAMAEKYFRFNNARCAIVAHNRPASASPCTSSTDTHAHYFRTISVRAQEITENL